MGKTTEKIDEKIIKEVERESPGEFFGSSRNSGERRPGTEENRCLSNSFPKKKLSLAPRGIEPLFDG
jgi:hypothetical protein